MSSPAPRRALRATVALALLALAGCAADPAGVASEAAAVAERDDDGDDRSGRRPLPVLFDTDMDFDDAAALAYLAQQHKQGRIDLLAVTVVNNGAGLPGSAIRHARCILARAGLTDVPVADGSPTAPHQAAPELRGAVEFVLATVLADCTEPPTPSVVPAPRLIAATLAASRDRVTVLTTGPLTNLAAALEAPPPSRRRALAARLREVYVMGGALDAPGNLCCSTAVGFDNTQELNVWIDPPAAQAVFSGVRPGSLRLVALDATQFVPITPAFVARLNADATTPEARLVASIANHPVVGFGISLGLAYWWDPLAAVAMTRDGVVAYDAERLSVVQDSPSSGRTVRDRRGDRVRVAIGASQSRFEQVFLDGLNGRTGGSP